MAESDLASGGKPTLFNGLLPKCSNSKNTLLLPAGCPPGVRFLPTVPSVPIYMRHFPPDSLDSKGGKENANGKERFSHSNEGGLKHQEGP